MSCKTCSSKSNSSPKGCKNNGTCGTENGELDLQSGKQELFENIINQHI